MKFSKEPVAYLTLAAVILNLIASYLRKDLDLTTGFETLSVAVGGVILRQSVYSKATVEKEFLDTVVPESDEAPAAELVLDGE